MGKVKELWQDQIDAICENYRNGRTSREHARVTLEGYLPFDQDHIDNLLEAVDKEIADALANSLKR